MNKLKSLIGRKSGTSTPPTQPEPCASKPIATDAMAAPSSSSSSSSASSSSPSSSSSSSSSNSIEFEFDCGPLSKFHLGTKTEIEITGTSTKILLASTLTGLFAVGNKCTHYGAPLVNGVLDGCRIKCPWHGASFDCKTGDIEDAPALDAIPTYAVRISEDEQHVFVTIPQPPPTPTTGTSSANQTQSQPPPSVISRPLSSSLPPSSSSIPSLHFIIIGGGAAGCSAAQTLRIQGKFQGKITIISNEYILPYDRTKLSKTPSATMEEKKLLLRSEEEWKELRVEVRLNTKVIGLDNKNKTVTLQSSATTTNTTTETTTLSYTQLLICTGSTYRTLPIPHLDSCSNIFFLRQLHDAQSLWTSITNSKPIRLVIIGSGFIGAELAAFAIKQSKDIISSVTVIQNSEYMFPMFGERVGKALMKKHEMEGVKFISGANVKEIKIKEEGGGGGGGEEEKKGEGGLKKHIAVGVVTDQGLIEGDIIVCAVGAKLNTDWLKSNASIQLESDGSIRVDSTFYSSANGFYAAGDIATYPNMLSAPSSTSSSSSSSSSSLPSSSLSFPTLRIEHYAVAQQQGRTAALSMLGQSSSFGYHYNFPPFFWSAQYFGLRYVGSTMNGGFDTIEYDGNVEELKFVAYYCKGEEVVAVLSMQRDPVVMQVSELLRKRKMPSKTELIGMKFELKSLFP